MTEIFRYAIVRFRPFAETGEFANIGVIATNVTTNATDFRLAPKRFARVKHFFDSEGYAAYRAAVTYLRSELERLNREVPLMNLRNRHDVFAEISRNRESSIVFSDVRAIRSSISLDLLLDSLYNRYIGRNFGGNENAESALTKNLRTSLHLNGIRHFKTVRIDDDVVPIIFPLGYKDDSVHAIKPLAFEQKMPLSIFDYGIGWKNRLEYLFNKNKIQPYNIMLAVQPPSTPDSAHEEAFFLVEKELRELPLEIVRTSYDTPINSDIVDFARRFPDTSKFLH